MYTAIKLQPSNPMINKASFYHSSAPGNVALRRCPSVLRLPVRRFTCLSVQSNNDAAEMTASSEPSISSNYTFSVGSSPIQISQWNLTQRHILLLNVIACAAALSATWLFCSAIPTLLAFKRAAESLEKLMDVTREELPDTMAAVRLSGMEISDLTMELSDLGQEITQGVRKSTRAVRVAEERLRQFSNMNSPVPVQEVQIQKTESGGPALATAARAMREGIVKGRAILQLFFARIQYSTLAFKYLRSRPKRQIR